MKKSFFLFLMLLLTQDMFAGNNATISFFYCDFDIKTLYPWSPGELIEEADMIEKSEIEESFYERMIQEFQTMDLEQATGYYMKIPVIEGITPEGEIKIKANEYTEINSPPYINTRLVIQLVNKNEFFTIAIGNNNTISIGGSLYKPNDVFKQKLTELLDLYNFDKIKSDFLMFYPVVSEN